MVASQASTAAEAVTMLAELAGALADAPSLDDMLQRALTLAIEIVPGCEQAGISLQIGRRIQTPASVGPLAAACDRLQEQLGVGPCVTALRESDTVRIDDILTDNRWPQFREGAIQLGLRSMFACRLATKLDRLGALNLYSTAPSAFHDDTDAIALAYATHVGLALSALDKETNLQRALDSREVIGQAMGILMERHRVTATQGFDLLVHVSQLSNVKLRDIADHLVRTGSLPAMPGRAVQSGRPR